VSSGLLRRVALVRTDVSEEPGASFIRVTKIGALGTTQAVLSVLTRATRRNNPEDTILQVLHVSTTQFITLFSS
jgi:predicted proteasome-type protease